MQTVLIFGGSGDSGLISSGSLAIFCDLIMMIRDCTNWWFFGMCDELRKRKEKEKVWFCFCFLLKKNLEFVNVL